MEEYSFIHPTLARACPLYVAILGLEWVEERSVVSVSHSHKNCYRPLLEVSEVFSKALGVDGLEVVSCSYLEVEILVGLEQNTISTREYVERRRGGEERVEIEEWKSQSVDLYKGLSHKALMFILVGKRLYVQRPNREETAQFPHLLAFVLAHLLSSRDPTLSENATITMAQLEVEGVARISKGRALSESGHRDDYLMGEVVFPPCHQNDLGMRINLDQFQISKTVLVMEEDQLGMYSGSSSPSSSGQQKQRVHHDWVGYSEALQFRINQESHQLLPTSNALDEAAKRTRNNSNNLRRRGPVLVEQGKLTEIGIRAELFVHQFLEHMFGEAYQPVQNWVSSARTRVFPHLGTESTDDGKGYDFWVSDSQGLLVEAKTATKCLIEVKGCGGEWKGDFHLSANENARCERTQQAEGSGVRANAGEKFLVLVVEYCDAVERIGFAAAPLNLTNLHK